MFGNVDSKEKKNTNVTSCLNPAPATLQLSITYKCLNLSSFLAAKMIHGQHGVRNHMSFSRPDVAVFMCVCHLLQNIFFLSDLSITAWISSKAW